MTTTEKEDEQFSSNSVRTIKFSGKPDDWNTWHGNMLSFARSKDWLFLMTDKAISLKVVSDAEIALGYRTVGGSDDVPLKKEEKRLYQLNADAMTALLLSVTPKMYDPVCAVLH